MTYVVINNCYLIYKKICIELASDAFNVTIAMRNLFCIYQEKLTRLIVGGLYKHMYFPSSISIKYIWHKSLLYGYSK